MPELTDVQWIFVVLGIFYLSECLVWIRPGVVALGTRWGQSANLRELVRLTGNETGNLRVGGLAPFDCTWLTEPLPLSISPDGVVAYQLAAPLLADRPSQPRRFFTWAELTDVDFEQCNVVVGNRILCRTRTKAVAEAMAMRLMLYANADPDSRESLIDKWQLEPFDLAATQEKVDRWRQMIPPVQAGSTLFLGWVFVVGIMLHLGVLPVPSSGWVTVCYLIVAAVLWWGTVTFAMICHSRLVPMLASARTRQALFALLSPATAMRLPDAITRDLFEHLHPLTLAAATMNDEAFQRLATIVVRDHEYPLPEEPLSDPHESTPSEFSSDATSTLTYELIRDTADVQKAALQQILDQRGCQWDQLTVPPAPEDSASKSYCQRCHQQFDEREAVCESCGNRATVPF
ncbi:MAG: hypothetical protein AAGA03_03850 [Planctomycetota bacterium]